MTVIDTQQGPTQSQNSANDPSLVNLKNPFTILHGLEFLFSLITLVCVAQTKTAKEITSFGYIIAVAVFSIVFAATWLLLMLFGIWPGGRVVKVIRLIVGFLVSELYLAAFAICCAVADYYNVESVPCGAGRFCTVPSNIKAGYGAATFFSCLAWLSHAADVGLAWYYHGGILPRALQNP